MPKILKCQVKTCGKSNIYYPNLQYFYFPKKEMQLAQWIQYTGDVHLIGLPYEKCKYRVICEDHFDSSMFLIQLNPDTNKKKLVDNAIPTKTTTPLRKRKHLTEEQKEIMISFMEANGDICSSSFISTQGKEKKQKLTEKLTHSLNSCETGVIRSPKEWLKSWNDNKNKTKSKAAYLARYRWKNGGQYPSDITPLTPWEERIMGVIPTELFEKERHNVVEATGNGVGKAPDCIETAADQRAPTEFLEITMNSSVAELCEKEKRNVGEARGNGTSEVPDCNETTSEQRAPTEFLEITMDPTIVDNDTLEAGPSGHTSEYELTDQGYNMKQDESSESTPTKEPRRRRKRARKLSNSSPKDEKFERLMQAFIKVQQENSAAVLQLAASFKEGCKYIADSCNNIAAAYAKKE